MEEINITEVLKDKPVNTKLYSPLFGNVYFSRIIRGSTDVEVLHHGSSTSFYNNATYMNYKEAEPLLFPSKEMRDWHKFSWKKGDVLIRTNSEYCIGIFDEWTSDDYSTFSAKFINLGLSDNFSCSYTCKTEEWEKMENSKNYISKIERVMNGKLNLQTLEIQTQPEFKDGDIVYVEKSKDYSDCLFIYKEDIRKNIHCASYTYILYDLQDKHITINNIVLVDNRFIRLATDSEKQQLFKALAKENKAWDAEKKMIVDLKPKVEFYPFDKVLVRNCYTQRWRVNFFSSMTKEGCYICASGYWNECIPYNDETAKLIGTTDNWKG